MLVATLLTPVSSADTSARDLVLAPAWFGEYLGFVHFHSFFPPRDEFSPGDDADRPTGPGPQIRMRSSVEALGEGVASWLTIGDGPMATARDGERLEFGPFDNHGIAKLLRASPTGTTMRSGQLRYQDGRITIEVQFSHSSGDTWWRYVTLRLVPEGMSVTIWVFDREGTNARSWMGTLVRSSPTTADGHRPH